MSYFQSALVLISRRCRSRKTTIIGQRKPLNSMHDKAGLNSCHDDARLASWVASQ